MARRIASLGCLDFVVYVGELPNIMENRRRVPTWQRNRGREFKRVTMRDGQWLC
jgi:hypothetical protein